MNISMILRILGWILKFEGLFMLLPCMVSLIYKETDGYYYLMTAIVCWILGFILTRKKVNKNEFYIKDGLVSVSVGWLLLSFMGTFPFFLSGAIPSFSNALFESVSGFTTTGVSILSNIESLSRTNLFWRCFTHFIGGMGVLVFILAIIPLSGGSSIYLMRAESPGPSVSKFVPKIRNSAKILYLIYIGITLVEIILLFLAGVPLFDSITLSLATTGTGGFAIKNDSIASYSPAAQWIVIIFMILCGINFNIHFLILMRKGKEVLKSSELRLYSILIVLSAILISFNIRGLYSSVSEIIRVSLFQVSSMITTTGFFTVNYNGWPEFSKCILIILMFVGACAGSTGGGIKLSRIIIMFKSLKSELDHYLHPKMVKKQKMSGKPLESNVIKSVNAFMIAYVFIFLGSLLLISLDNNDFTTNFAAIMATINNIGVGFGLVGPYENFDLFSTFSKFVLMFNMIVGRLELFPVLILLVASTWKDSFKK